jgi:hypothetical protein
MALPLLKLCQTNFRGCLNLWLRLVNLSWSTSPGQPLLGVTLTDVPRDRRNLRNAASAT